MHLSNKIYLFHIHIKYMNIKQINQLCNKKNFLSITFCILIFIHLHNLLLLIIQVRQEHKKYSCTQQKDIRSRSIWFNSYSNDYDHNMSLRQHIRREHYKIQDDLDLIEGNPRLYVKEKRDQMRNLYSRARREILALIEQQGRSSSGRDNVSFENLLTPQSMVIRFICMFHERKLCCGTLSNYTKSMSSASCPSKYILPFRSFSKSFRRINNIIKGFASILFYFDSFLVPTSDIKKGKKTYFEIDSMIKESSQTITAACSVLPTFLNATFKADTEEDKSLITFLSHGLKRVPVQQKIRCMIKILEVLESFQQN
ncbi:hypothetical protein ACFW04_013614 [Cataglyphis niger]